MSYLFDTNIVIAAFKGDSAVLEKLEKLDPRDVILCSPVLAELEFGARSSRHKAENLERIGNLIGSTRHEPFDLHAARLFGEVSRSPATWNQQDGLRYRHRHGGDSYRICSGLRRSRLLRWFDSRLGGRELAASRVTMTLLQLVPACRS